MKQVTSLLLSLVALGVMLVFTVALVPFSRSIAEVNDILADESISVSDVEYIGEEIEDFIDIPSDMLPNESSVSEVSSQSNRSNTVTSLSSSRQTSSQSRASSSIQGGVSSGKSSSGKAASGSSSVASSASKVSSAKSSSAPSLAPSSPASQSTSSKATSNPSSAVESPGLTVIIEENGKAVKKPVKEVLAGIVANEMGESMALEALKAQAVAAHTYIRYCNDIEKKAPSVKMKAPVSGGKVEQAVNAVYDKLIYVNNKVVYTPYHSTSAGRTQASSEVWGGALSHLVSVESKYDKDAPNFKSTLTFTRQEVIDCIKKALNVTPSGDMSTWFTFLSEKEGGVTSGGYVGKIKVCGVETTGRKVRENIMVINGKMLRSAKFTVAVSNDNLVFTTYGYGHGVGMSQYGAHFYAKNDGMTYDQILRHYYTGVVIGTVN